MNGREQTYPGKKLQKEMFSLGVENLITQKKIVLEQNVIRLYKNSKLLIPNPDQTNKVVETEKDRLAFVKTRWEMFKNCENIQKVCH